MCTRSAVDNLSSITNWLVFINRFFVYLLHQACGSSAALVHPRPAELIYFNFQPLEVVSRYRDPQPQVAENYLYLLNLSTLFENPNVQTEMSFPITVI